MLLRRVKTDKAIGRWTWQNTHLTKKISDDQRITLRESRARPSKSGQVRRRPVRPRASLTDKISNLHLLLRVPSFARWPLQVRFFCEEVYRVWRTWCDRTDGETRSDLDIVFNVEQSTDSLSDSDIPKIVQEGRRRIHQIPGNQDVTDLDVSYDGLKDRVGRGLLLAERHFYQCAVCSKELTDPASAALLCPQIECSAISHVACLAKHFGKSAVTEPILPIAGNCAVCKTELRWIDLVKELSLRARGVKEKRQLFKAPRVRKTKIAWGKLNTDKSLEEFHVSGRYDISTSSVEDSTVSVEDFDEGSLPDDWLKQCDDDSVSISSTNSRSSSISDAPKTFTESTTVNRLGRVIEDSDWELAEVVD